MLTVSAGRVGGLLAVVTATVLTVLAVPPAADAAGGGCRKWSGNDFSMQVCMSNEDRVAYADVYIDQVPADCLETYMIVEGPHPGWAAEATFDCSLGHKGPIRAVMEDGEKYDTKAFIRRQAAESFVGTSPLHWF